MRQSVADYKQSQYNFVSATSIFVAVCLVLYALLAKDYIEVSRIAFLDVVIIALASMRLIRLFCYDSIFRYVRESIAYKSKIVEENGESFIEKTPVGIGFRRMVIISLDCPWCIGMWTTILASVLYVFSEISALFVVMLAIAGVASVLQILISIAGAKCDEMDKRNRN